MCLLCRAAQELAGGYYIAVDQLDCAGQVCRLHLRSGTSIWLVKKIRRLSEGGWRSLTQYFGSGFVNSGSGSSPDPGWSRIYCWKKSFFKVKTCKLLIPRPLSTVCLYNIFFWTDLYGRIRIWTRQVIIALQSYNKSWDMVFLCAGGGACKGVRGPGAGCRVTDPGPRGFGGLCSPSSPTSR